MSEECAASLPHFGQAISRATAARILLPEVSAEEPLPEAETKPSALPGPPSSNSKRATQPDFDLRNFVGPGDVLFLKSEDTALMRIGTSGGFLGHVLQVIGAPSLLHRAGDVDARYLESVWPSGVDKIWSVKTLESTRDAEGLYEVNSLLYVDPESQGIVLLGQDDCSGDVRVTTGEEVVVWHPPAELRSELKTSIMSEVVEDMKVFDKGWSLLTAVRSVFFSAAIASIGDESELMADIRSSWTAEPICTSIVVVFWQRYLTKVARATTECDFDSGDTQVDAQAVDSIRRFMPLKADRVLPGDLHNALSRCGWCRTTEAKLPAPRNHQQTRHRPDRKHRHICRSVCL